MARVVAITNPASGRGRGARMRAQAFAELRRRCPGLEMYESRGPGDATEYARRAADADIVIAIGGDGTVREVATGLINARAALAVVPVGSGNDFCASVGIPRELSAACATALDGRLRAIDAMRVELPEARPARDLVCVNVAGFGFDAQVAAQTRRLTLLRGKALYLAAVLPVIWRLRCPRVRIVAERFSCEKPVLLIAAANGRFFGGGLPIVPGAAPDDGALDVCIIDAVSRLRLLEQLPALVRGTHVRCKEVTIVRTTHLEVEALDPLPVELDGDMVPAEDTRRVRVSVLPAALRVMTP